MAAGTVGLEGDRLDVAAIGSRPVACRALQHHWLAVEPW